MKLFLIDGHALIFKTYYAFLRRPMINTKGEDTSIIFGFTKTILELIRSEQPTHLAVAFDPPCKTFRHDYYAEYKANRSATPELVKSALPSLIEIMHALNIPVIMQDGYEADDMIGTYATLAGEKKIPVFMYTPDKDYGQLLSGCVFQYKPPKSGEKGSIVSESDLCEKYNIEHASQFMDILSIWGDTADNIPGIRGIGEVGAAKLISKFGSIDNIYSSLDSLTPKQKAAFEEGRETLERSRFLVRIKTDIPVECDIEKDFTIRKPRTSVNSLIEHYEMFSLKKLLGEEYDNGEEASLSSSCRRVLESNTYIEKPGDTEEAGDTAAAAADKAAVETFDESYREVEIGTFLKSAEDRYAIRFMTSGDGNIDDTIEKLILCSRGKAAGNHGNLLCIVGKEQLEQISAWLEDAGHTVIGYGIKPLVNLLRRKGIILCDRILDVELMHYLINPERSHSIDMLSETYLGFSTASTVDSAPKDLFSALEDSDSEIDIEKNRCLAMLYIEEKIQKEMEASGMHRLYFDMEMPLIKVLAEMEYNGVKLDTDQLAVQRRELEKQLEEIEREAREAAGEPELNLSSPKQVGIVIYEKLSLGGEGRKKKKTGYPTDEETLTAMAGEHRFIPLLLEYRGIKKLLSTYIVPLPEMISPVSGRIHTTFNQALTSTGRLSSTRPNLQNIPIRTPQGREIRRNFISGFENGYIVAADYSQIELRLMAVMSQDSNMLHDFKDGKDIHAATASRIFGTGIDEVTKDQRRQAKTANFGIIYGISAFGLSQRLDIGRKEAKSIIDDYFASYPHIKDYIHETIEKVKSKGYIETLFGRRRYLPDINSRNAVVRSLAERNAVNAPIQGSAADIIKLAMIDIYKAMKEAGLRSKMILQVHDELIFDVCSEELETIESIVTEKMQNVRKMDIPLTVDCNHGKNWLEAH